MINLLLVNNFCPVMSYRRVQKESVELLYTDSVVRYGPRVSCQRKRVESDESLSID